MIAESQADKRVFEGKLKRWLADPVVLGLGQTIIAREAAEKKRHDEMVRLMAVEKNMLHCQLQKKTEECEWMNTTRYNSDEKIAELTDTNQKLKKTLATVQKRLRGLATRCSKATQKDVSDLQMHALCLLTQTAYFAPVDETGNPRARSRSPRRER